MQKRAIPHKKRHSHVKKDGTILKSPFPQCKQHSIKKNAKTFKFKYGKSERLYLNESNFK